MTQDDNIARSEKAQPMRCSVSFPHPPHDYCDGNPDGDTLADVLKSREGCMVGKCIVAENGGMPCDGDCKAVERFTNKQSDVVRTLRNMAASSWAHTYEHDHVLTQAADQIERLEQRVAQLEASRIALSSTAFPQVASYRMLMWSTDDQNRPVVLIGDKKFSNEESIRLRDELVSLLPFSAIANVPAWKREVIEVPRHTLNQAACAVNRDRWACSRSGDEDGAKAMDELHDEISTLLGFPPVPDSRKTNVG